MTSIFSKTSTIVAVCVGALGLSLSAGHYGTVANISGHTTTAKAEAVGAGHPRRIALLIANANYPDAGVPIGGIVSETHDLADSLRERGFDVVVEENAPKAVMDDAIDSLVAKGRPGVDVLIAFSGYGIQDNRENFLIPTNARIWNKHDISRSGFAVSKLLARLQASGADHVIAVLDASRRNPFERRFRSVSAGLAAVDPPPATIVMSTTIPTRSGAADAEDGGLVRALVKTLQGPDKNIETLFGQARHKVSLATKGREVPTVTSAIPDSFTF